MAKNKIQRFGEFTEITEKKKEIKKAITVISNEREEKRKSVKKCTSDIRKLKRKLKKLN